ncbi:hypothetical protein [Deinococcus arenicola]|uniref:MFS transporter n=1 Tax=Deinococcus arenicola TaxID=2994950 RepID=A0ABU4DVD8_9DEIO|nr:hypothetical protein [Deinococcus sp. ZS9-10]MDV6376019.1 hypothetical protein [Deinococcus sp. ZS9-10]
MLKRLSDLVINTALLLYAHAVWGLALLLAWGGLAFAQGAGDLIPGIPAEWQTPIVVGVGLLSGFLVGPLTAIAKKLGRTTGPSTVAVSAALSLIVAVAFVLIQAATTREDVAWTAALWIALLGFIRSNGAYISSVAALIKGAEAARATVVVGEVQAPADLKSPPPSGFENRAGTDGQPLNLFGAGAIGSALVQATLGTLLEGVLGQLHLPATADNVARLALKLIKVFPDLADGNFHLNWRNRADILEASRELMDAGGLK